MLVIFFPKYLYASAYKINFSKEWKEVKDLYGIPVTLLGPSVTPKPRAVIQIIPTSSKPIPMKEEHAKAFGEKYAEGRKRWVTEQQGQILEILPGNFDNGRLWTGVSYKIGVKRYLERTYFVNCSKNLYHLKIILNFENLDSLKESESIVRSFACDS